MKLVTLNFFLLSLASLIGAITEIRQIQDISTFPVANIHQQQIDNNYSCSLQHKSVWSFSNLALLSEEQTHSFKVSGINASFSIRISHSSLNPASFSIETYKLTDEEGTAIVLVSVVENGISVPELKPKEMNFIYYNISNNYFMQSLTMEFIPYLSH